VAKKTQGLAEFARWMAALLDCLRAVGGSAKPREVLPWIRDQSGVSAEILDSPLKSGQSRFYNQVHWARQYLVWEGLIDDSRHGVWELTPLGWKTHLDARSAGEIVRRRSQLNRESKKVVDAPFRENITAQSQEALPLDELQEHNLLAVLKGLPPFGFELLCERLLREHGFEDVRVTQKTRDGGIDGYGTLRLSPFVSVKVAFQAKRYKDVVSRAEVGEFRNALLGRAEKGVFITTGRYTADAEAEAIRDGVIPIELIDGERLVELFEEAKLGVKPRQVFEIDHAFFDQFREKMIAK
jgi:restriction system protein